MPSHALSKHAAEQEHAHDTVTFGFWIYLMTDCILFASLFAVYAVLRTNTAGGPSGAELFNLPSVLTETMLLLTSSLTCGLAMLAAHQGNKNQVLGWLSITLILGLCFLGMEVSEFRHLVADGDSWRRSGFLSAFFSLVGTHGLHIATGSIWLLTLMLEVVIRGLNHNTLRKLACLSLFWHFLDIIWIFIFTIVYLMGSRI